MKKIILDTNKLKLQKEKITDLIQPKTGKNAGITVIGCTHPTTTAQPTFDCF